MLTGILFQLPSGLANGGLLSFASTNNSVGANYSYGTGFQVAEQLVSVAVGLTVGLFCSFFPLPLDSLFQNIIVPPGFCFSLLFTYDTLLPDSVPPTLFQPMYPTTNPAREIRIDACFFALCIDRSCYSVSIHS
ncbi:hypothetical protein AG1IA_10049 [Rhizoctonia solani AG-1 IA]|uniref:Uncharacterized protein n=1 Tax=Thanatephorus cucumeris (strain AG1-IA) TaxID=983506 RepID=L8WCM5_THACA|nr:hypothetical protein AG1IA_10049 [Rhizoctonia solani AG-1 IA]